MPNALWVWDVPKLCLTAILLQSNSVRGLYSFAYIYIYILFINGGDDDDDDDQ